MIDKINDLEYRNDRLETILITSPKNFSAMIEELDTAEDGSKKDTLKIRQNLVMMRTMSLKMTGNIPKRVPDVVFTDKNKRSDPIFEALAMKLEEFKRILEGTSNIIIVKHFSLLCIYVNSVLTIINKKISDSHFLQQRVCFMRCSGSNSLINMIGSEENFGLLELFEKVYDPDYIDGTNLIKITPSQKPVYHPFIDEQITAVRIERRIDDHKLCISFTPKEELKSPLNRVVLRKHDSLKSLSVQNLCMEVFKLFNQIWKYKTFLDCQSPPKVSVLSILEVDAQTSAVGFLDSLTLVSKLPTTKLTDSAREAITFSCAGTLVAYFVMGIEILPQHMFFDKTGNIIITDFDYIFGSKFDKIIGKGPEVLTKHKGVLNIPDRFMEFFDEVGTLEMTTACLAAYINLRKFGNTINRMVKMTLGKHFSEELIHNYMKSSLLVEYKREEATEKMKEIIKKGTRNYSNFLEKILSW